MDKGVFNSPEYYYVFTFYNDLVVLANEVIDNIVYNNILNKRFFSRNHVKYNFIFPCKIINLSVRTYFNFIF